MGQHLGLSQRATPYNTRMTTEGVHLNHPNTTESTAINAGALNRPGFDRGSDVGSRVRHQGHGSASLTTPKSIRDVDVRAAPGVMFCVHTCQFASSTWLRFLPLRSWEPVK